MNYEKELKVLLHGEEVSMGAYGLIELKGREADKEIESLKDDVELWKMRYKIARASLDKYESN